MEIDHVTISDLSEILKIEQAGFNSAEAGSKEAFINRINNIADTFLVAKDRGQVIGFIVGPIANSVKIDDKYYDHVEPNPISGNYLLVLSIAVAPNFRGSGIGSTLLSAFEKVARDRHCLGIALDTLDRNVPFYEQNGFIKMGISPSSHANETWYNMVKRI